MHLESSMLIVTIGVSKDQRWVFSWAYYYSKVTLSFVCISNKVYFWHVFLFLITLIETLRSWMCQVWAPRCETVWWIRHNYNWYLIRNTNVSPGYEVKGCHIAQGKWNYHSDKLNHTCPKTKPDFFF